VSYYWLPMRIALEVENTLAHKALELVEEANDASQ
jgi:hypothetical protein